MIPNETKLFHFHGIFKKHDIKSAKRTTAPLYIPLARNPGSAPCSETRITGSEPDHTILKVYSVDISRQNSLIIGQCVRAISITRNEYIVYTNVNNAEWVLLYSQPKTDKKSPEFWLCENMNTV